MYKCSECNNSFSSREASCENWRNPKKSFGCPQCGAFFEKDFRPISSQSYITGIMSGGIFIPAFSLVASYFKNGELMSLLYGGTILVSCIAIYALQSHEDKKNPLPLKRVDS